MFCPNCGKEISDGVNVCPHCNKPVSTSAMLNEKAKQTLNFATEKAQSFTKDFQENIKSGNYKNFLNKKNIIVVAAVLLVFIIAANLFGGRKSIKPVIRELEKINTADARAWGAFVKENGINAITSDNMTLLQTAVASQNDSLVKACLKAGADPNRTTIYNPPLIVAISSDNYKMTEVLLKAGANLRGVKDANLVTLVLTGTQYDALYTAVQEKSVDMIKLLIPYYKKAKLLDNSDSEINLIYFGCDEINHEIVKILFESGFIPSFSDVKNLINEWYVFREEDSFSEWCWKNVITKFCPDKRYKNKIVDRENLLMTTFDYIRSNRYRIDYGHLYEYIKYMVGIGYDSHTDRVNESATISYFLEETGLPYLENLLDIFIKNKMSLSEENRYLLELIEDNIEKSNTLDEANKWLACFKKLASSFEPSALSEKRIDECVKRVNTMMEIINNPSLPFIARANLLKPYTYYNERKRLIDIKNEYGVNCVILAQDSLNGKSAKDVAAKYECDIILLIQSDDKNPDLWVFSKYDNFFIENYEENLRYRLTANENKAFSDVIIKFINDISYAFYSGNQAGYDTSQMRHTKGMSSF